MSVPRFHLYGEPDRPVHVGFIHVESILERRQMHHGKVAPHRHERLSQITFWLRGHGDYVIEDRKIAFSAPAASFIPSGVVHGFTVAPDASDAIVASVADSALPPIRALAQWPMDRPIMAHGGGGHPSWTKLRTVMKRLHADYREGQVAAAPALVAVASHDIAVLSAQTMTGARPANDLALAFRTLAEAHFRDNWPVERYVAALGVTPHLLARACQTAFGATVKAYIAERRLIEAKRLLLFTLRSVEDIAYELGFHDPAYFSRFFARAQARRLANGARAATARLELAREIADER